MRIPINLASEPFRRDRPIVAAYAACAIALTLLLAALIFLILGERHRARDARQGVARVNVQLRTLAADQAKIDAFLRQPPNAQVLQRSLLLNELIQRKSISWTRIFADLEDVLPYNVHLVSVRLPQVTSRKEVVLDLMIGVG
jgi:Tfp pilus assembly protein PilN